MIRLCPACDAVTVNTPVEVCTCGEGMVQLTGSRDDTFALDIHPVLANMSDVIIYARREPGNFHNVGHLRLFNDRVGEVVRRLLLPAPRIPRMEVPDGG